MNKQIQGRLTELSASLEKISAEILSVSNDELAAFNSMPLAMQNSDDGAEFFFASRTLRSVTMDIALAVGRIEQVTRRPI